MSKTYPYKFIDHLLQMYNLASEKELINAVNNNNNIKEELLDYLEVIRRFKIIDSVDNGIFCIESNTPGGGSTYKYQENGVVYDKKIFVTFGECLIYAESISKEAYYNPFLSHVIKKHFLKNKEELTFLLKNDCALKAEVIKHLHKTKHIYTELKTYDGRYCLSNYPSEDLYSYVFQERGSICQDDVIQFYSQEECLVYALIGKSKLDCWINKNH